MNWTRIWRFIRGYVIITVDGYGRQMLVEMLRRRGIPAWDARGEGARYTLRAPLKREKEARDLIKKRGLRILKAERRGLPVWRKRLLGRPALFALIPLAAVLASAFIFFAWYADLSGFPAAYRDEARAVLSECGVRFPMPKSAGATAVLRDKLLIGIDELSWASVEFSGVALKVEGKTRVEAPATYPQNASADVVAARNGVVVSVAVTRGTACVSPGDAVRVGDVLISGVAGRAGYERAVEAAGIVVARVACEAEVGCDADERLRVPTGRSCAVRTLVFCNLAFALDGAEPDYADFDTTVTTARIPGTGLFFPVSVVTRVCAEYARDASQEALEALYLEAAREAETLALRDVGENAQVVGVTREAYLQDGVVTGRCYIETLEDIGVTRPN